MKLVNSISIFVVSSGVNAIDNLNKRQPMGLYPGARNDLTFVSHVSQSTVLVTPATFSGYSTHAWPTSYEFSSTANDSCTETSFLSPIPTVTAKVYTTTTPEPRPGLYTNIVPSPKYPTMTLNVSTFFDTSFSLPDTCTTATTSSHLPTLVLDTLMYSRTTVTEPIPWEVSTTRVTEPAYEEICVTTYTRVEGQETSIICETLTPPVSVQVEREVSVTTYTRVEGQETSIICETLTPAASVQVEREISVTTYTKVKDQETSIIYETLTPPVSVQFEHEVRSTTYTKVKDQETSIIWETSTPPVSVQIDREISVTTYTRVKDQETSIICETLTLPVTLQEENGAIKNVIGAGIGLAGVVGLLL